MKPTPRILVVEDESLIALDLSRRLPRLGYEVCGSAATGEEAVRMVAELRPDLVLMDICLRGEMDGIGAAELIRQHGDVPVIFLTANSDAVTVARSKACRPSSYLLKPFKERELQIAIEMALLNHKLQIELQAARSQLESRVKERTKELALVNDLLRLEVDVRKRAEMQARAQADLLAKASDAIYVCDLDGIISYWNPSAERLYGVSAAEAQGRCAPALLGEDGDPNAAEARRVTLTAGEWTGELRHLTHRGESRVVESRWTLVRDEDGEPRTILVVNTDVTERKRNAEQLMRTQRLESVGSLASGIAHDLNNVFAPILLAADLITKDPETERARMVEVIKTSAWRGSGMVRQVLMFVRGGSNQMEPTAIDFLATEVTKLMQEALPSTIRVQSRIAPNLGLVEGDGTQLHQVLVNLCVNARDAMPEGGELTIELDEVSVSAGKARNFGDVEPGRFVRIVVGDTGTGIPPEVRSRIFDQFFTTKELGKGTGLGLSTVATIVRNHHGFIEVESEMGRGSRFIICLPISVDHSHSAPAPVTDFSPGQSELIIVADDDRSVQEITKLALEANNYRVILAADGAEALSLCVQHRNEVRLVITDVIMPIMNGRALGHALHKLVPNLPIIAFTAAEESDTLVSALLADGATLLHKPATQAALLSAVDAVLHPHAAGAEPACSTA